MILDSFPIKVILSFIQSICSTCWLPVRARETKVQFLLRASRNKEKLSNIACSGEKGKLYFSLARSEVKRIPVKLSVGIVLHLKCHGVERK